MGKNNRRNKKTGGGVANPPTNTNTMDKYITKSAASPDEKEENEVEDMKESSVVGESVGSKEDVKKNEDEPPAITPPESRPQSTTAPKTPSVRYEAIYPDENEQERDVDCLVPGNSPSKSGDAEAVVSYSDIYKEIASPTIPQRDDRTKSDSSSTEVEKATSASAAGALETEDDLSQTWREVDEEKDEDISVLTDNILTPAKETASGRVNGKATSSSKQQSKQHDASLEATSSTSRYSDIIEDYLVAISDGLVAIVAFFKPNSKYQDYNDYLKVKISSLLWPFTFFLPNIVIEIIRFFIVTYLLFLGSCGFLWWYSVKYTVWVMLSPWRFFQRALELGFQIFVYLTVGFVNNARGGNKIPMALNGHVTKH